MFEFIFAKLLAAPVIGAILKPLIDGALSGYKAHLDAVGSHEAVVAEIAKRSIELDRREAEVNATVVIAEQGNWVTRWVRPALALPVVFIVWKLLIWDKALGDYTHGHTDALDEHLWWVITTIIISYMGGRSLEKVADKISGIWKR